MNIQLLSKLFRIFIIYLLSITYAQATSNTAPVISGTVIQTMDASNYTYVHLDTGKTKLWAAGPVTALTTGKKITIATQMPMSNFYSKALERKFKTIYFVPYFTIDGKKVTASDPHTGITQATPKPVTGINKAKNGQTINEIITNSQSLNGKSVIVRGKVMKYSADVLNTNWLHIDDGSSTKNLTVTTNTNAKIGDIVLVKGQLATNKDLGYGYLYDVIIENASIRVE